MNRLVVIKGGGDLASGIAHRLFRCGFDLVITEIERPTVIRRSVAFANAIFEGKMAVEEVTAVKSSPEEVANNLRAKLIPVVIDPDCKIIAQYKPWAVVDAILAKYNIGTRLLDAPVVIGVGPGFTAGVDVHRVVESMRGHDLGRVITNGSAAPNTGVPGEIGGYSRERLVMAPQAGVFTAVRKIGDLVKAGDLLGNVDRQPVLAAIGGVLRGILHDGLEVRQNMKIGDIDPRAEVAHCWTISDKARAIGGGVLEALLMSEGQAFDGDRLAIRL